MIKNVDVEKVRRALSGEPCDRCSEYEDMSPCDQRDEAALILSSQGATFLANLIIRTRESYNKIDIDFLETYGTHEETNPEQVEVIMRIKIYPKK